LNNFTLKIYKIPMHPETIPQKRAKAQNESLSSRHQATSQYLNSIRFFLVYHPEGGLQCLMPVLVPDELEAERRVAKSKIKNSTHRR
jgi:hypothetical protein